MSYCKCGALSLSREFLAHILAKLAGMSAQSYWDPLRTSWYLTRYARMAAGECSACIDAHAVQVLDKRANRCESCDGTGRVNISEDKSYAAYVDCGDCSSNQRAEA